MSAFAASPWQTSREADRRFTLLVRGLLALYVIAGIIIPLIKLAQPEDKPVPPEARYVTLVPPPPQLKPKPKVTPTPQPQPKKQPQPRPVPTPAPQPKPELTQEQKVQQAREKAAQKMQALSSQLTELRDRSITAVDSSRALSSSAASKSDSRVTDFAATASKNSSGITSHAPSQQHGDTKLGQRETTSISSPVGFGRDASKIAANGAAAAGSGGRNDIQPVFDRATPSFYAIFMRAMRENPNIKPGTLRVEITIAPDGSVTDCKIISNAIGDQAVADKVVARIKMLNFGAKNIPAQTIQYPIVFQPS